MTAETDGPFALEVERLTLNIGGAEILTDVSLQVAEGVVLGVIGPNGAGKTTLFNVISGVLGASSGRVLLHGTDVTTLPPHKRAAAGLGRTFQISSVFPKRPVRENVWLAAAAQGASWRDIVRRRGASQAFETQVEEYVERVGLAHKAEELAGSLSNGDKRKLELAMVLATEARTVLLDEPMAGMSTEEVPALMDLIGKMQADHGRTVLIVEHDIHALLAVATRLVVMHYGTVLAEGTPAEVVDDPAVRSAYLGEEL